MGIGGASWLCWRWLTWEFEARAVLDLVTVKRHDVDSKSCGEVVWLNVNAIEV